MILFQSLKDVILTERAILRINAKLSEVGENPDSIVRYERDICNVIDSISIRSKFKVFNNCDQFRKANGIHMCLNAITTFNDVSDELQESVVLLILRYLHHDEKRGMYTTANAIQSSISVMIKSPFEKICELHGDNEDIFHWTQELLHLVSRAKEKQCLQLFEYIEKAILFDVQLPIFRRLIPPPRDIDDSSSPKRDELEILIQETRNHSSNSEIMRRGMSVLIKLIQKRNLFTSDSTTPVDESLVDDISMLLISTLECGDYDTQLKAFSLITRSSNHLFAANTEVACAILSFLIQPNSNLHFLAIFALSMCCSHDHCVRALELKGLKSFLYKSLYSENDDGPKVIIPLNLKLLYTREELLRGLVVDTSPYSANMTENTSFRSDLEPTMMKSIPEYGTVDNIFEQGEPGLV
jgi:hypothetical protein